MANEEEAELRSVVVLKHDFSREQSKRIFETA